MLPKFRKRKTAASGKWKWQTSICLLQTGTENDSFFSLVDKPVIDDCCFIIRAHLWKYQLHATPRQPFDEVGELGFLRYFWQKILQKFPIRAAGKEGAYDAVRQ